MPTTDYYGTESADIVERAKLAPGTDWITYYGLGGDDKITWNNGTVFGGPGNDTIIGVAGQSWVNVAYWDAPKPVYVDLAAGYADDGWGTRDTLVNIRNVSGTGTFYGSAEDDSIALGWSKNYVDGRGGEDTVTMDGPFSAWTITASVDGRTVAMTYTANPAQRSYELHNVEWLNFWNTSERVRITDLIDSSQKGLQTLVASTSQRWNAGAALGSAVTLTYSFTDTLPSYGSGTGTASGTGAAAWTTTQRDAVRASLAAIASVTQITFKEVADGAASFGQLRFGLNAQAAGSLAYAYGPDTALGHLAGDVWLDTKAAANLTVGSSGWLALQREIGRALGLKAPLDETYTGALPVLVNAENDSRYTLMSANDVMDDLARDGLAVYDVSALRALYGTRALATGDNTYAFGDSAGRMQTLIVDDGGKDTIDASQASAGALIDLREGHLSSIGRTTQDFASIDNISLAFGTVIEAAIGTNLDDRIIGNAADNLIYGLDGNDYIDGGPGFDTVRFAGRRSDYSVYVSAFSGKLIVSAGDGASGTDTLTGIEKLVFADMSVKPDMAAVAKTISSADLKVLQELYVGFFNRVPDAEGLSYWIGQRAAGVSVQQIGDTFYGAAVQYSALTGYSATMSNADFIRIVYKNVLGRSSVDQGGLDYWTGELAAGRATRGYLVATILSAAHTFKGTADYGWVADLLDNKLAVATEFAISQGLSYNTSESSIINGMAIAAAVTPTDTGAALALIGIADGPIVFA